MAELTQDIFEQARGDFDHLDDRHQLNSIMSSDEQDDETRIDSARTQSYLSDNETNNNNSMYSKYRKR